MNPLLVFFILFVVFDLFATALIYWLDRLPIGEKKEFRLYILPRKRLGFSFRFTKINKAQTKFRIGVLSLEKGTKNLTIDKVREIVKTEFPGFYDTKKP